MVLLADVGDAVVELECARRTSVCDGYVAGSGEKTLLDSVPAHLLLNRLRVHVVRSPVQVTVVGVPVPDNVAGRAVRALHAVGDGKIEGVLREVPCLHDRAERDGASRGERGEQGRREQEGECRWAARRGARPHSVWWVGVLLTVERKASVGPNERSGRQVGETMYSTDDR